MGATTRSAVGTAVLVLLVLTGLVSTVVADPGDGGPIAPGVDPATMVSDAQSTVNDATGDAQTSAEGGSRDGQEAAKDQVEGAETLALTVINAGLDVVAKVQQILNDATKGLAEKSSPGGSDAGYRVQSDSVAIARPFELNAPLIWVAASASGLTLLIIAVRRLLGLGAIPLLSRIAHSEIYNNDARRTIHELVLNEPGQCLNDLVSRTGYSRNAVSYHLFVLEKEEEIVSVKDGKYRRYFCRNGKYVNGAKNVVAALRNETTLKLARVVLERPGAIQRDLCVELGATPSATCWHAKRLLDLGVIRKERVANTVKYYPGEAMAKYDLSDMGLPRLDVMPAPQPAAPTNA